MLNKKLFQYFTKEQYWKQKQILNFIYKYPKYKLIDPFAGDGDLLKSFSNKRKKYGFDIDKNMGWKINNSLESIPKIKKGFIITNPPYLSKVSSKRKKINHQAFITSNRGDLYQIALNRCFESEMPGIAIIPETFINSNFEKKHIYSITILIPNPFKDTETPVCIICFNPKKIFRKTIVYKNDLKIGFLEDIKNISNKIFNYRKKYNVKFNVQNSNLALIAYDSISGNKIKFLNSNLLNYKKQIKISSRVVTKIDIQNIEISDVFIKKLNTKLNYYRKKTNDILLSPFKGNFTNNNERRRRLDFKTARNIINSVLNG